MTDLVRLSYMSHASQTSKDLDLINILWSARRFNAEHNITGILVYGENLFLQILEGSATALRHVMNRIIDDPRHRQVHTFYQQSVDARIFESWHLGYHGLTAHVPLMQTLQNLANLPAEDRALDPILPFLIDYYRDRQRELRRYMRSMDGDTIARPTWNAAAL